VTGTLWIAAKAPRPGAVKTRLARSIGDGPAARIYAAFLGDLAARFAGAPFPVGWYVEPGGWPEIGPLVGAGAPVLEQRGADWTERQQHLFRTVCDGTAPVVLIASDSPHVRPAVVGAALRTLRTRDLVLGPVADGGYWLLGMRAWHDVLAGVAMSTADACEAVRARAGELGLTVGDVPGTFDVDEAADLARLRRVVRGRRDLPRTAAALAEVGP
jgi:glycosyltransferase A (GT-A) superfamily protein (DUF2064 family)